ncbi:MULTISPECIES: hypothetical protein [Curtobacterium]|jgi:hypothetical protein|uniref:Uncharacterized protein n=2 Tax=Curtobacterium TaxID=2034 RepID=A0A6N1CWK3_9MICO|nr:hypothetical protein [Curtobacterium flaccumfaciens]MBO9041462.1 hypothetical protein [Curtobacterium flaccumfaciens pv. flaccumfaciens]MBO9044948.1 hypothetical protein [Curtobacterium flaccumfaciens pv. flaccumfaciens]MBO9048909.1 hypothetical protein [Curtobacterium flaccumfaciens pv. flaccumfaciens]MBO9057760.1 hypothetical protein [Curtobacterium flaccumfaciens pv. flaccumfaciens]MBT1543199.1 hypothetical protein [Curtobacterium flaccumfaciens pv. flaccumfaciens]
MTTNHTTRSQTPDSLGEIGLGKGTSVKVVYRHAPRDLPLFTVQPAPCGGYAALRGTPLDLNPTPVYVDLETTQNGEVR